MKIAVLSAAAVILSTTVAYAADLAPTPAEPLAPAAPYSWTGFYAGLDAGAIFGHSNAAHGSSIDGFPKSVTGNGAGFIGGAHIGYNYQFDEGFVVGVESDIDYSSFSKKKPEVGTLGIGGPAGTTTLNFKNQWQGSTRVRIGYAFDRFLPYLTAGVAYGDSKVFQTLVVPTANIAIARTVSSTRVGWTAGAGLEYAVDQNWWIRGEVRYVDLGEKTDGLTGTHYKLHSINTTLGVSYRF